MSQLRDLLIELEGFKLKPYRCTAGKLTIAVGRNLEDVGISEMEGNLMLANDIERVQREAVTLPWFKSISVVRQDVIHLMIFQLGLDGFKEFKKTIEYIRCGNFEKAADEMLDSDWAINDTPARAKLLSEMMRLDRYPKR